MTKRSKILSQFSQFPLIAFFSFIILASIIIFSSVAAYSAQVTLAWDPNAEQNLAGYKLYYGFESGNYTYSIDAGNQLSYSISDLEPNRLHYFAATAYDTNGNESDFSEEVTYLAPSGNMPPVANAGLDQTVAEGYTVTLSGLDSSDPDDGIASYLWEQTGGPAVSISSPTDTQPTFVAPDASTQDVSLTFQLTVEDFGGLRSTDTCVVNVSRTNTPPIADAGPDQTVTEGYTVTLRGLDSSDPDDGIASYLWEQTGGPAVSISAVTDIQPTFVAPDASTQDVSLTFQLTVEDFGGLMSTDTCVVNVSRTGTGTNFPPVADAGPDQTVDEGITVTLDESNSTDPNNDIVSYLWEQTNGPAVVLSNPENGRVTFTAPDVGPDGVSLSFRLTATDSTGLQSEDDCIVNVSWVNIPPTANAALDQTVDEGYTVTLSGLDSSDPDDGIASFLWEQTGGPAVSISAPTDIQPTFVAPDASTEDVSLTFQLTVEDFGGLRSTDTCVVNVSWTNQPPVADAGPDQTVDEGVTVTLDGSNSSDPDDGVASVRWKQLTGTPVGFSNPTALKPTFVVPDGIAEGESLTFQLTVTDIGGLASQDTCTVMMGGNIVYEDAEDGNTDGWSTYDNRSRGGKIRNVFDSVRQSRVIKLKGTRTDDGHVLRNEDGTPWHNSKQSTIQWSMQYREHFVVYLDVETSAGHRYIYYTPDDYDYLGSGEYVHHGLGSVAKDGQWHTFTRDLQSDLAEAQPGVSILEVNAFALRGNGKVDDIQLLSR